MLNNILISGKDIGGADEGQGGGQLPGKLNVKTGPPLAYILIFSIIFVISRLLCFGAFRVISVLF